MRKRIAIIGGGLAGSLLAIVLARRDYQPTVYERRGPFGDGANSGGRSINLALASRGINALRAAGVLEVIEPLLIPMRGRMIHETGELPRYSAYGQHENEVNYSVSRELLNNELARYAMEAHGIPYEFSARCEGMDAETNDPLIDSGHGPEPCAADIVLAADGAGSAMRKAMQALGVTSVSEDLLDHGYKELTIPPDEDGAFAIEPHALHIWPRGDFMLIALPNTDRTFTATLFLPLAGDTSFATIGPDDVRAFFGEAFPDAVPLLPSLELEYAQNLTGVLGTIRCSRWSHAGKCMLLGDAAHAIVPFHGQGMNAAFEDVIELAAAHDAHAGHWPAAFETFERSRIENANAIADMALENYLEMRDHVRDPQFALRHDLGFELEKRFPGRFIPRYSMVMFHPEIPYADAMRRGARQEQILSRLTRGIDSLADVDFALAERLIDADSVI